MKIESNAEFLRNKIIEAEKELAVLDRILDKFSWLEGVSCDHSVRIAETAERNLDRWLPYKLRFEVKSKDELNEILMAFEIERSYVGREKDGYLCYVHESLESFLEENGSIACHFALNYKTVTRDYCDVVYHASSGGNVFEVQIVVPNGILGYVRQERIEFKGGFRYSGSATVQKSLDGVKGIEGASVRKDITWAKGSDEYKSCVSLYLAL